MNREAVEKRLAQLNAEREEAAHRVAQAQGILAQLEANVHAYNGAIQECEHWLVLLDAEQPPKKE